MSSSKPRSLIRDYRLISVPMPTTPREAPSLGVPAEEPPCAGPEVAAALLAEAQAEAERIRAEATAQAALLRQQAEITGRQQGFEAGRVEGREMFETALKTEAAALRQLAASVLEERRRVLSQAEGDVVELAQAIARKVIGDLAASQVEVIQYLCEHAVQQLAQTTDLRIHVHPQDAARLAAYWIEDGPPAGALEPDERVPPGSCMLTSGASMVDARLDTQMGLIQQAFRSLRGA